MSTEKRALLATALSILILIAWQHWFAPHPSGPREPASPAAPAGSASPAGGSAGAGGTERPGAAEDAAAGAAPVRPAPGAPARAAGPAAADDRERIVLIESRTTRVKITNVGARVVSWRLLQYQDEEGHPLELVPEQSGRPEALPLELVAPGDDARTRRLNEALYVCEGPRAGEAGPEVVCRWSDGRSEAVEKRLMLDSDGYLARLSVRIATAGGARPLVVWAPGLIRDEGPARYGTPSREPHLVLAQNGSVQRVPAAKAGDWQPAPGPTAWCGVEGQYFAVVFIPEKPPGRFALFGRPRDPERPLALGAGWDPDESGRTRLFVGPKSYELLRGLDAEMKIGLERLVNYGQFWWIAVPLFKALKWLHRYLHSYGLAIIVLTIIIKLIFYPITQRSMVSMRRLQKQMKRLQPKVQHIRDQFARKPKSIENRNRMNQEIMELYRRENVNPMASMTGCLPLLLQIPILWAFYSLLSASIELRGAPFLYLRDLSARDPYYITPVIMGATMWIQQRMSGAATPDPAQRWMMNFMPFMMTWLFINFPSGLVLYWLVSNLLGIGQQYLINRQAEAAEATPSGGRASGKRG